MRKKDVHAWKSLLSAMEAKMSRKIAHKEVRLQELNSWCRSKGFGLPSNSRSDTSTFGLKPSMTSSSLERPVAEDISTNVVKLSTVDGEPQSFGVGPAPRAESRGLTTTKSGTMPASRRFFARGFCCGLQRVSDPSP